MTTDLPKYDDADAVDESLDEPVDASKSSPGSMRKKLCEQASRIAELEAQVTVGEGQLRAESMNHAYEALKLDPEQGIGRAAATLYDGEADGLAQFVQDEFGYTAAPDQHPMAAQIALGNAQLDQVGNVASAMLAPASREERLATARAAGDYGAEGAIMAAQMETIMRRAHR